MKHQYLDKCDPLDGCKFPTHLSEERVVVEEHVDDNGMTQRRVVLFQAFDADKFIEHQQRKMTSFQRKQKYRWYEKMIEVPMRNIPTVSREYWGIIDEPIHATWCQTDADAERLADEENADAIDCAKEEDVDGFCYTKYKATTVAMDDEDMMEHFGWDEEEFKHYVGCIPQTYSDLINPMNLIPYPNTRPLPFPEEN